jgi:hypothetical protein
VAAPIQPSETIRCTAHVSYCAYALGAAGDMPTENSVEHLVALTLAGLLR